MNETDAALDAGWIDGIAMTIFDKYLFCKDQHPIFFSILKNVNNFLIDEASVNEIVSCRGFSASKYFLIPELNMVHNLFFEPNKVPDPPHIFVLGQGWVVA